MHKLYKKEKIGKYQLYTKNKKVFPTDDAALKSIYLAAQQIRKKREKMRFGWPIIYNQLTIYFENRIIIN